MNFLRQHNPDLVVITPLVFFKTKALDLARAAIELGIRNVFAVASWDHLSSKGMLNSRRSKSLCRTTPQKRKAIELIISNPPHCRHRCPAVRRLVRQEAVNDGGNLLCACPSARRPAVLLYVCSSLLEASPQEPAFILRWVRHLRESGHRVFRDCGSLFRAIRNAMRVGTRSMSLDSTMSSVGRPRRCTGGRRSKTNYFDPMYHAPAVVKLNTSAMIEAAIVGGRCTRCSCPKSRTIRKEPWISLSAPMGRMPSCAPPGHSTSMRATWRVSSRDAIPIRGTARGS